MWLGDASADSGLVLSFLREWTAAIRGAVEELRRNGKAAHLDALFMTSEPWVCDPEEMAKASAAVKFIFAQFSAPFAARAFDDESWGAVNGLFERRYWTRIWILQEMVLANAATVMCGAETLDLADLLDVLPMFQVMLFCSAFASPDEPALPLDPNHIGSLSLAAIRTMRASSRDNSEYMPLICMAHDTTDREATDPCDRVFALLGLVPGWTTSIVPNYSLSAQQVFTDVMVDHLRRTGRYVPIAGIGQNATARLQGLPSWAPDFTIESRAGTKPWYGGGHGYSNARAARAALGQLASPLLACRPTVACSGFAASSATKSPPSQMSIGMTSAIAASYSRVSRKPLPKSHATRHPCSPQAFLGCTPYFGASQ